MTQLFLLLSLETAWKAPTIDNKQIKKLGPKGALGFLHKFVKAKAIKELVYLVLCWGTIEKNCHHVLSVHTPQQHFVDL